MNSQQGQYGPQGGGHFSVGVVVDEKKWTLSLYKVQIYIQYIKRYMVYLWY